MGVERERETLGETKLAVCVTNRHTTLKIKGQTSSISCIYSKYGCFILKMSIILEFSQNILCHLSNYTSVR